MNTIRTKKQLKNAIGLKTEEFVVVGELASTIYKNRNFKNLSKKFFIQTSLLLGTTLYLAPFTSGYSLSIPMFFAYEAAEKSIPFAQVAVLITSLGGASVFYAIYKEYDIEFEINSDGSVKAKFHKK